MLSLAASDTAVVAVTPGGSTVSEALSATESESTAGGVVGPVASSGAIAQPTGTVGQGITSASEGAGSMDGILGTCAAVFLLGCWIVEAAI